MKTSKNGLDFIIQFEGLASKSKDEIILCTKNDIENDVVIYPYRCQAGYKTIGIGCMVEGNDEYDDGIKISQIIDLFHKKIQEFEIMIKKWIKVKINQNQFDALVCFCFNIPKGAKAVCEMINENDSIDDIQNKWLSFCNIKGIKNPTLQKRRLIEFQTFIQ